MNTQEGNKQDKKIINKQNLLIFVLLNHLK
jgi:hypothetical protein